MAKVFTGHVVHDAVDGVVLLGLARQRRVCNGQLGAHRDHQRDICRRALRCARGGRLLRLRSREKGEGVGAQDVAASELTARVED